MSTTTVRGALTAFFQAATIPGLNKVFPAPPYYVDGADWDAKNQLGSGAVAALHLAEDRESRITVPALTGQKMVTYQVGLIIFYQWLFKSATLTAAEPTDWAGPLDAIIDGVKDLLRSDPNCGMPSVIWQSAQDPNDVRIQRDIPKWLDRKIVAWNVVEFTVHEVVTA